MSYTTYTAHARLALAAGVPAEYVDSKSRTYRVWVQIHYRLKKEPRLGTDWLLYGNFYRDMGPAPDDSATISRKSLAKPYTKDNCIWKTAENALALTLAKDTYREGPKLTRSKFLIGIGAEADIQVDALTRRSWLSMLYRCFDTSSSSYPLYSLRAPEKSWLKLSNFYKDMGARPSPDHSLERIDNTKGYSADNCCWATYKQQARNRSSNRVCYYEGKAFTLVELAEYSNVAYATLRYRLNAGWPLNIAVQPQPPEEWAAESRYLAVLKAAKAHPKAITVNLDGSDVPLSVWCRHHGKQYRLVKDMYKKGTTLADILSNKLLDVPATPTAKSA